MGHVVKKPAHPHRRLITNLLKRSGKKSPQDFKDMEKTEFITIHPTIGMRCWKLVQYILGRRKRPY